MEIKWFSIGSHLVLSQTVQLTGRDMCRPDIGLHNVIRTGEVEHKSAQVCTNLNKSAQVCTSMHNCT